MRDFVLCKTTGLMLLRFGLSAPWYDGGMLYVSVRVTGKVRHWEKTSKQMGEGGKSD